MFVYLNQILFKYQYFVRRFTALKTAHFYGRDMKKSDELG